MWLLLCYRHKELQDLVQEMVGGDIAKLKEEFRMKVRIKSTYGRCFGSA